MKTLIASGAALLIAGAASAADVQVVMDPDAEGEIIVRHVEWHPSMAPIAVAENPDDGMLSADEVGVDDEELFGFDPEAVIYIWEDQATGVRVMSQPID